MKSKLNVSLFVFLSVFTLLFTVKTLAATLSLTKIGAMDTGGKNYSEWWYTVENPSLSGTATKDTDVTIKVDDKSGTAKADGSGNWTYSTATALGDHTVSISSGSEKYDFKLHITKELPSNLGGTSQSTASGAGNGTGNGNAVPSTGLDQAVALGLGLGLTLLATYMYISGDNSDKVAIEKKIVEN